MVRTIATNTPDERDALLDFIRCRHKMILLTPRKDGGWQGSPVTAGYTSGVGNSAGVASTWAAGHLAQPDLHLRDRDQGPGQPSRI